MKKAMVLMGIGMAILSAQVQAELIVVKPTGATASSVMGPDYAATKAIDASGLFDSGGSGQPADVVTGAPVPAWWAWPTDGAYQDYSWISSDEAFGSGKWIEFDLGQVYSITGFRVWNYNNTSIASIRGARQTQVQYKDGLGNWVNSDSLELAIANSTWADPGTSYDLSTPFVARTVRFLITSNWGDTGNLVSVSEVRFIASQVTVHGTVVLNDYSGDGDPNGAVPIAVRVELRQGSTTVLTANRDLDASGGFTIANVPPGTYNVAVKSYAHLQKILPVTLSDTATDLGTFNLLSGDNDGNNAVTSTDLSIVLGSMDNIGN